MPFASRISVNIPYTKEGDYIKIKGKDIDFSYVTSEFINNVIIFRGQESGVNYAEAFVIWRIIKGV